MLLHATPSMTRFVKLMQQTASLSPTNLTADMQVKYPYHVRVLVPCYKESLEILRRTIMAAYDAQLPEGCHRTIYLCDDGKDPKKRKWVDSLAADVVYVSGRKRPSGELNYP